MYLEDSGLCSYIKEILLQKQSYTMEVLAVNSQ